MTDNEDTRRLCHEALERAEKATPGPWKLWGMSVATDRSGTGQIDYAEVIADTRDPDRGLRTFNADFIAPARTDVPLFAQLLLDALRAYEDLQEKFTSYTLESTTRVDTLTDEIERLKAQLPSKSQEAPTLGVESKDLRCTFCDELLMFPIPGNDTYECLSCPAEWNPDGTVRKEGTTTQEKFEK